MNFSFALSLIVTFCVMSRFECLDTVAKITNVQSHFGHSCFLPNNFLSTNKKPLVIYLISQEEP